MKIHWLGHACFLIETNDIRVVTDPFDQELGYPAIPQAADIVCISHDHWDHNALHVFLHQPVVFREEGSFQQGEIRIRGVSSYHDKHQGRDRGSNMIFKIQCEGIDLVHLGDLGQVPDTRLIEEIGNVDILLIPVGGTYTIDAKEAVKTVELLHPKVVIPMHFATPAISFPIDPVEAFTAHYDQMIQKAYLEIDSKQIKGDRRIIVLDYLSC